LLPVPQHADGQKPEAAIHCNSCEILFFAIVS